MKFLLIGILKFVYISFYRYRLLLYLKFTIFYKEIFKVDQVYNLGIIFSEDLSFSSHINSIYIKVLRVLGFFKEIVLNLNI